MSIISLDLYFCYLLLVCQLIAKDNVAMFNAMNVIAGGLNPPPVFDGLGQLLANPSLIIKRATAARHRCRLERIH